MSLQYRVGDVFERLAEIPDGTIDLIVTSPPFLALRSYLADDHQHKHLEIGSEATPAEFIDTLLALTAEWGRVLAPHGSLCVELGDTFSGQSAGTDSRADETGRTVIQSPEHGTRRIIRGASRTSSHGPWPLAKSLTGIPTLYPWSLAYGRNLLTGNDSPAGQWRIRNMIVWARPNPPVGALGDKFRPATSYITVACRGPKRYFDLDAVRVAYSENTNARTAQGVLSQERTAKTSPDGNRDTLADRDNDGAGAPPLDWHQDDMDGDWLWKLSTQPYKGSHYATFPLKLPKRLIEAMCPQRVCTVCGQPSTRIVGEPEYVKPDGRSHAFHGDGFETEATGANRRKVTGADNGNMTRQVETLGWTDCGHNQWRTGIVLDPFAGSGTTLDAAQAVGRHAIGIDLDPDNAELARQRVGMFMEVHE